MPRLSEPTRASLVALMLVGCGGVEAEPLCVSTRLLELDIHAITRSGLTLQYRFTSWHIGRFEADDTITPIAQPSFANIVDPFASLDHDPISGHMWLLVGPDDPTPAQLLEFDGDGQLLSTQELIAERPVLGGTLLHHDGSLYLALSLDWEGDIPRSLQLERRDLDGAVLWTRNEMDGFASAHLIGVAGNALAMVATPPLIDYGPSYPLTVDIDSGETLWSSAEHGHDPLRMVVDDEHLYLAWASVISDEASASTLSVHAPDGTVIADSEVEWRPGWEPGWDDQGNIALGWMGEQLVSLVETEPTGVTVHAKDGSLVCKGSLDQSLTFFHAVGSIDGRDELFVVVNVPGEQPDEDLRKLMVIEPMGG